MGVGAAVLASSDEAPGAVAFAAGMIVGPSVGHFYADHAGRGIATCALRAGVTVLGLASIAPCLGGD